VASRVRKSVAPTKAAPDEDVASESSESSESSEVGAPYAEGDVIGGKYVLVSMIGRGGMGFVWQAHNTTLDTDVAVKLLRSDFKSDTIACQRFLREARAAARIQHPSICRVHDFGQTERGDPYIVMELLNGESLAAVLYRKRALPAVEAIQVMLPICGALVAAHGRGIVHRDLKPENIVLVAADGGRVIPKLLDFGVAKLQRGRAGSVEITPSETDEAAPHGKLTRVGHIIGSPDYLSPEQARGDDSVDHRADLWALSLLLYEVIVGRRPFVAPTVQDLLVSIISADPAPIAEYGIDDAVLWGIISKGLRKDPGDRWQKARHLAEALAGWLDDHGVETDATGMAVKEQWLVPRDSALPSGARRVTLSDKLIDTDPLGVRNTPSFLMMKLDSILPKASLDARSRRHWRIAGALAVVVAVIAIFKLAQDPADTVSPGLAIEELASELETAAQGEPTAAASTDSAAAQAPAPAVEPTASASVVAAESTRPNEKTETPPSQAKAPTSVRKPPTMAGKKGRPIPTAAPF